MTETVLGTDDTGWRIYVHVYLFINAIPNEEAFFRVAKT